MEKCIKRDQLTDAQSAALEQFKKNLSDILNPYDTDAVLLKWLRARNYNPKKAEMYFREMYSFKKLYGLDIDYEFKKPDVVEKYEYTAVLGFAKDGSIVRYSQMGLGDHFGFIMSLSTFELVTYAASIMLDDLNIQRQDNKMTGVEMNEITYIFDVEHFSLQSFLHKCVIEMGLDLGQMVQDYYPEVWGNIFFINVPTGFDTAYNIFKPILRANVVQKLQIVSRDSTSAVLLKYIDEDVLPVFLGGKRVDSRKNPRCAELLRFGGKVPRKYYLCNQSSLQTTDPDVTTVSVAARGIYNYALEVRKPNSTICIEYRTENGSINQRILFRKFGPEPITLPGADEYLDERDEKTDVQLISPPICIQAHVSPVNDTCNAPWPGIYIFKFSNNHSWFRARRLIHRIIVMENSSFETQSAINV